MTGRLALHVLAPGLLNRARQCAEDDHNTLRCVGIETLLARSARHVFHAQGIDATLCALFGIRINKNRELPLGALRRYGLGAEQDARVWLCADPVHLSAGISQVFLQDDETLNITRVEAKALADMFAAYFAGENWALEVGSPRHWHLRLPAPTVIGTPPARLITGRPIEAYLPAGEQGAIWRARLNEIQMLFHGADVNHDREQRGERLINGLWLSGAGSLPAADSLRTDISVVWSDDPVAIGLSRLAGIKRKPAPASLDEILHSDESGQHLVCLNSLLAFAGAEHMRAWSEALQRLDVAWFRPIDMAIKRGRLARCDIYDCAGRRFCLSRARQWSLWRRRKPLQAYDQTN